MRKKDTPKGPVWKRAFASVVRMCILFVSIVGVAYWWNPQKIHYPVRQKPANFPKLDPDSAKLFSSGTKVTVVVGHPDDAEYYISGTLLKLHDTGAAITLIVVTDGDKSYYPWFMTNATENRKVRHREQLEASSHYGGTVVFLGGPDGRYNPDEPVLRKKLEDAIVASNPDYLLAFDSEYVPLIQHRDHENSGRATSELAPESSAKWLLLFASTANNYYVDTEKYWDGRAKLIAIHKSQFSGEKLEAVKGTLMQRELDDGVECGLDMAEGFRVVKLKD